MSIVCSSKLGWLISHFHYISTAYKSVEKPIRFKQELFEINVPFRKNGRSRNSNNVTLKKPMMKDVEVLSIQYIYNILFEDFKHHFHAKSNQNDNICALETSAKIYEQTKDILISNTEGANLGPNTFEKIYDSFYIFPENCEFYCRDTSQLSECIPTKKFDLILLDPPWWNKFIRRKRKRSSHAYKMMYNEELKDLKLEILLHEDALVAVWCTNSPHNINFLKDVLFPKWGVNFISKWYWLKITKSGEPICSFSEPPGKQPYEQIIFGCKNTRRFKKPPNGKLVMSVPSALHSHKPPLIELLEMYLPEKPRCLEIFARYLLPGWTSYGNEVLKFQHESLYDNISEEVHYY